MEKTILYALSKGRQFHLFSKQSQEKFFTETFEVTAQSDRMGYRLKGAVLPMEKSEEMISEAVSFGSIQVPADGNPIVLLADRQTTGGYPKIGQIATVDLPMIAQAKPVTPCPSRKSPMNNRRFSTLKENRKYNS